MKAVVYQSKNKFFVCNRPLPEIEKPTDAIVKVTLTSICSSDLHIKQGVVPKAVPGIIVGHEFVGVVEKIGPAVKKVKPGDRVAVNVETFCGQCFFCRKGSVNNCEDPQGGWALGCRIDGGQAEFVRIPYADFALTHIPDTVSDQQALFTGDILSTGYWAAQLAEIQPKDTIVVLGAGPTGICAMMCAALSGPRHIIAVDTNQERLKMVRQHGWADTVICPDQEDIEQIILNDTNGRGADAVIEAAGGADTFQTAWRVARPGGIVCVVAMYEKAQILPLPEMYGKNLIFKTGGVDACHCDEIMNLIAHGKIDTTPLITHEFQFDQIMEAYDIFEQKKDGVVKVAIHF
ncbi:MAG: alcohol dehydrogenase catalytic domain-containing protein [Clostridiales bacterium]|nr:alcohol dehydrogenase catalytic domain-containing protein [Clostridiales bacterium]